MPKKSAEKTSRDRKSSTEKAKKKSSQLVIRVSKDERDEFVALCEELDTSAAREIRHFMRRFVAEHESGGSALGSVGLPSERQ
ncbi:MAG: hypothetical protein AAGJ92_03800 [Pseudomonadota bacterium]